MAGRRRSWRSCGRVNGIDLRLVLPVIILLGLLAGVSLARWTAPASMALRAVEGPACLRPTDENARGLCGTERSWRRPHGRGFGRPWPR
jgi:hypothetical protein